MDRYTDTLFSLLDQYTGEWVTYNKVTTLPNGNTITDGDVDGIVYVKSTLYSPSGEYFKRNYNGALNLKWFGAQGKGLASYETDKLALEKAVEVLRVLGGGSLYIPATDDFYGYYGNGILLPSNVEIFGDGKKSQLRNINPDSGTTYRGVIFYTCTYGPTITSSIFLEDQYDIEPGNKGDISVTLVNSGDAANLSIGQIICLGGNVYEKDEDPNKLRFAQIEQNKIVKITGPVIELKYPLSMDFTADVLSNPPVIIDINSGNTNSTVVPGYTNRTTENISIHDLSFTQAQTNEISNIPLVGIPNATIQLGGIFEGSLYNLWFEQYAGGVNGNMLSRSTVSNIHMFSKRHMIDFGYGSHNTDVSDIYFSYYDSPASDLEVSLIYISESSHDLILNGIYASGSWNGNNLCIISSGSHNISVNNFNVDIPTLSNSNFGIVINDDSPEVYSTNVNINNVYINVQELGQFIRLRGELDIKDIDRNISISNIEIYGALEGTYTDSIFIHNFSNIRFYNIKIPVGNIDVQAVTNASLGNIYMPESDFVVSSDKDELIISNCSFKTSNLTSISIGDKSNQILPLSSDYSVYLGVNSGKTATGSNNVVLGGNSGVDLTNEFQNIIIGTNTELPVGVSNGLNIKNFIHARSLGTASARLALGNNTSTIDPTAFLQLPATTTNYASLKIPAAASNLGTPLEGDLYRKTGNDGLFMYQGSSERQFSTLDGTETLTNKTIRVTDANFFLLDDGDTTKIAKFQCSGISTATTRTYTLPNNNITILGEANTATITNKTIGDKIRITTGSNASAGTATLVGGTVTVSTTSVATGSIIMLSRNTPSGTTGNLSAPSASIVNATSFVINSVSGTDTSTVNWLIIN